MSNHENDRVRPVPGRGRNRPGIALLTSHWLTDAGQHAKSGHPGTPMALAPLVHTLWEPRHAL